MSTIARRVIPMTLAALLAATLTARAQSRPTEKTLFVFSGNEDGSNPWGGLAIDKSENLYGTTVTGGSTANGVVFQLTHSPGTWKETVIHNFLGPDGSGPVGNVAIDAQENIYGTTESGGLSRQSRRRWKLG
jgi:hypothetical protein